MYETRGYADMLKYMWIKIFSPREKDMLPTHDKATSEVLMSKTTDKYTVRQSENHSKRFTVNCCLLVTFFILFLLSVTFNVVLLVKNFIPTDVGSPREENKSCETKEILNQICLNCKYFKDSEKFLWMRDGLVNGPGWSRRTRTDDEDVCCFEYTDALHEMSKIFFLEHMSSESFQTTDRDRPMAHLTLNPTALTSPTSRLQWDVSGGDTGTAFMNHVQYADDTLVILESGSYYVYSFITFSSKHIQSDTFLYQALHRNRGKQQTNKTVEMLFMDKQIRQRGNLEYQTSFLAGIVNLKAGDQIMTSVSDVSAVYRSSLTNFMGLFKL